ncbi:MAG: hypothetical protein GY774_15575 [Planctomycetes bacterium]|nr:hypothetical protein [Planctomycetota bacterium]
MNVREIIRYYPASGTEAIFISQNTNQSDITAASWHIWDISDKGCSFEAEEAKSFTVNQIGVLRLIKDNYSDEIENVRIVRAWDTGMAVAFEPNTGIRDYLGKAKQSYPAEALEVMFIDSNQPGQRTAKSLYVWDISEQSCSFETDEVKDFKSGQTGELKIKLGFHTDVIPNVKIERVRDNGMIVSFEPTNKIAEYIGHKTNMISTGE